MRKHFWNSRSWLRRTVNDVSGRRGSEKRERLPATRTKRARESRSPVTLELTFRRTKTLVPRLLLVGRNRRLPSRRQRKSQHISIFRLLHPANRHHQDLRARRTCRQPK